MRAIIAALLCFCACEGASAQAIPLRYGQAYSALRSIFALPLLVAEPQRNHYKTGCRKRAEPSPASVLDANARHDPARARPGATDSAR